jgi:hypothetical protein
MLINDASITGSLIVNASASFQNISVGGNIIPDETNIRNLGSTDKYFKEIYVSTGSINFVDNGVVVATLNAGTINSLQVTTASTVSRLSAIESVTSSFEAKGTGIVSGSSQLTSSYDSRYVLSGSITQTTWDNIASKPGGIVSSSSQLTSSYDSRYTQTDSFNAFTSSATARLNSIETITSSNLARLNSIETITSSNISRLSALETKSASVDTTNTTQNTRLSALETTSASVDTLNTTQNTRLTSIENKTGSLASTGSNTFYGTQVFSGSLFIQSNLVVQGTSSLQNITASAVSIGTNTILLNTDNPAIRFGGISVRDSGSANGTSGSLYFDSTDNEWIFVHQGNTAVTSSIMITGPETYDSLGNETKLTTNRIPKSTNNFHIIDSNISDDGSKVTITTGLDVTGAISASTFTGMGNLTTHSASVASRLVTVELVSASAASALNSFSSSTATRMLTFATTGSNTFIGTQNITGQVCGVMGNFSCVGVGTTSISSTYGTLTIAGTGLSIADDGNAKLQIGRYSSTACNAYIKIGTNACSLRFTNNTDLSDLFIIDKGGNVTANGSIAIQKCAATDNRYLQLCDIATGGYRWDLIVQSTTQGCGFGIYNNNLNDYALRFMPSNTALFGYSVCAPSFIGGTISGTDIYASNVSCSPVGCFTTLCAYEIYTPYISVGGTSIRGNSNRLGIGTMNPLGVLSIGLGSSLSSLATYSSIEPLGIFNMFYTNSGTYPFYLDIAAIGDTMPGGSTGGSNIRFLTHCGTANATPVERMRITNCGYIGIGTTSPSTPLHVCTSISQIARFTTTYSLSSGYADYMTLLASNQTGGGLSFNIGKSEASYNLGKIVFNYVGDQSTSNNLSFGFYNYDNKLVIVGDGTVRPGANGTQNLGTASYRWSTVYTSDLDLSNGIGDYTIVEGENDLFLYNNKQCKVYKFMLEQVCAECATPKKS